MTSNHALHVGFGSLVLLALAVGVAACGASPGDPGSVDEKSLSEPAGDASDPDVAFPVIREAPAPAVPQPPSSDDVPRDNGPGAPSPGGAYAAPGQGAGVHTRS